MDVVDLVAGTGAAGFTGDGGPATAARLNFVHAAVPTGDGGYLIADLGNDRIRKVSASGVITTVAGNRRPLVLGRQRPGDGRGDQPSPRSRPAPGRQLPHRRLPTTSASARWTSTASSRRSREPASRGSRATADGRLRSSPSPFGVVPTPDGGFLIVDTGNQRIRKVSAEGIITTVAGQRTRRASPATEDRRPWRASTSRTTSSRFPTAAS